MKDPKFVVIVDSDKNNNRIDLHHILPKKSRNAIFII